MLSTASVKSTITGRDEPRDENAFVTVALLGRDSLNRVNARGRRPGIWRIVSFTPRIF